MRFLDEIKKEKIRQLNKWGEQNHDPRNWLLIALEELGESTKAHLEGNFEGFRKEMIQTAAVAESCLESIERIYSDPHFYLAGPMLSCDNDEIYSWRDEAVSKLNCKTIIPMLFQEDHSPEEIILSDKKDIDRSVGILANCWRYSPGTSMEILYAWERGKLIISVVPPEFQISAWIAYHSSFVFRDLDSAITCINEILKDF